MSSDRLGRLSSGRYVYVSLSGNPSVLMVPADDVETGEVSGEEEIEVVWGGGNRENVIWKPLKVRLICTYYIKSTKNLSFQFCCIIIVESNCLLGVDTICSIINLFYKLICRYDNYTDET